MDSAVRELAHRVDWYLEDRKKSTLAPGPRPPDDYAEEEKFFRVVSAFSNWARGLARTSSVVLSGSELADVMKNIGAGSEELEWLTGRVNRFDASSDNVYDSRHVKILVPLDDVPPFMSFKSLGILKKLIGTLNYFYRDGGRFIDDYRGIVETDSTARETDGAALVEFCCLNPGVCFSDFRRARSLIVASATLAPLDCFCAELELSPSTTLTFRSLDPPADPSRVWVGTLDSGPRNVPLKAVYRYMMERPENSIEENEAVRQFQDELGFVLLKICRAVPGGILCFFSSYANLTALKTRWTRTGLLKRLESTKPIFQEESTSSRRDFEDTLNRYYSTVREGGGALFLAVYRGRVGEGLNFAGDYARAVVTVGLPYPSLKDLRINLKRRYNDQRRRRAAEAAKARDEGDDGRHPESDDVCDGRTWYESLAFRALNQALGRCIRGPDDWGALVIIDQRFSENARFKSRLPKWIADEMQNFENFFQARDSLRYFVLNKK